MTIEGILRLDGQLREQTAESRSRSSLFCGDMFTVFHPDITDIRMKELKMERLFSIYACNHGTLTQAQFEDTLKSRPLIEDFRRAAYEMNRRDRTGSKNLEIGRLYLYANLVYANLFSIQELETREARIEEFRKIARALRSE